MSDALATLVEVKATLNRRGKTMVDGKPTLASLAIAEKAEETIFKYGKSAYFAAAQGIVTPQVESIIEANTLLSGLGFENGALLQPTQYTMGLQLYQETFINLDTAKR